MKKFFISILLITSTLSVFSQQATVIDSKSITVPRYIDLTAIQGIQSPQLGMMVYNIGTQTNWTYNGTAWLNTAGTGASQWNNSGSNIYYSSGNVGINITNSTAKLHINDGSFVATSPATNVVAGDNPPVSGAGKRMMWYPDKSAFRAGMVDSPFQDFWDKANTGLYSVAFGLNTKATGNYSFVLGSGSTALGEHSFAVGNFTGAQANNSISMGMQNLSNAIHSTTIGLALYANKFGTTSIGMYNDNNDLPSNTPNPTDRIFQIGNGSGPPTVIRSNALTVLRNANVGIGITTPNAPLQFANTPLKKRTIVLYEHVNNDYQFYGLGMDTGQLRYNVATTGDDHVFFAGVNSSSSKELFRIKGGGSLQISDGGGGQSAGIWLNNNGNTALRTFLGIDMNNNFGIFSQSLTSNVFTAKMSDGNIGINTQAPTSKLEINGTWATKMTKINSFTSVTLDESAAVWYFSSNPTVIFPSASTCTNRRYILVNSSGSLINLSNFFIGFDTSQKFDIPINSSIEIISDGSNWLQIK